METLSAADVPSGTGKDADLQPSLGACLLFCAAGAALNVFFSHAFKSILHLPLYMDTLFTIAATLYCGPFWGLGTGVVSNLLLHSIFFYGWPVYLYTLCNAATALTTILFMRRFPEELSFSPRRTPVRTGMDRVIVLLFLSFSLCVVMSLLGGTITAGMKFFASPDAVIEEGPELPFKLTLLRRDLPLLLVEILSRIPLNIIDRLVSVFGAYGLAALLSRIQGSRP
ncbi:MAG: hypothetical protein LBC51_06330 [Treponema sp.]|jgi:hypothetical protein|nr:hypothetical protein [Treponema sp.]